MDLAGDSLLEFLMLLDLTDESSKSVSPSFTHTSGFSVTETTTVHGTTGDTGRQTVAELVNLQLADWHPPKQTKRLTTMPASRSPSRYGVAVSQTYILMRPFVPSGGVTIVSRVLVCTLVTH